jgi:hypothetical protein
VLLALAACRIPARTWWSAVCLFLSASSVSLAGCGSSSAGDVQVPASASASAVAPSPPRGISSEAPSAAPARPSVSVGGSASPSPGPPARVAGITFATPVLIKLGGHNLPAVLVTNTTDREQSFTVGATWKAGDTVAGSAIGAVIGLAPRETRAMNLASQDPIPDGTTSAEAHVNKVFPTPSNFAPVARVIRFGPAVVRPGSFSTLEVPVTNLDLQPHTFMVGAALLEHGVLIGTASGQVTDIGQRLTLPVSLPLAGPDSGFDQVLVYVDGVAS